MDLREDSCEIWTGTQFQSRSHGAALAVRHSSEAPSSDGTGKAPAVKPLQIFCRPSQARHRAEHSCPATWLAPKLLHSMVRAEGMHLAFIPINANPPSRATFHLPEKVRNHSHAGRHCHDLTHAWHIAGRESHGRLFHLCAKDRSAGNRRGKHSSILTSIPKTALPFIFSGLSSRFAGVPISLKALGSFRVTFAGGVVLAACLRARNLTCDSCDQVRFRIPYADSPDRHPIAARLLQSASPKRGRSALRYCSNPEYTLELPPVICMPKIGWLY